MYPQHVNQLFRRWIDRANRRPLPARRQATLKVETFEDRVVPATLPAPFVTDTSVVTGGFLNPEAVYDPTDPSRVVLVSTNGAYVQAQLSTDGGRTFSTFYSDINSTNPNDDTNAFVNRVIDPGIDTTNTLRNRVFTNTSSPSVTYSRDGFIYLVYSQHTANKDRGVIVVHKFDARSGFPIEQNINTGPRAGLYGPTLGNVVYQWDGDDDPGYNPTIEIDNNLPTYTDPITGITRTNTMVGKAVYVAFNVDSQAGTTSSPAGSRIFLSGSSDGGLNFTNPLPVSSAGGAVDPTLSFTPDGKLVVGWGSTSGVVRVDVSQPDNGDAAFNPVSVFESPLFPGGAIADAIGGGNPDIPVTTIFPAETVTMAGNLPNYETVFLPDDFGDITDLDVRLSIIHTNLAALRVNLELVVFDDDAGNNRTQRTVQLFNNFLNPRPNGSTNGNGLQSGGDRLGAYEFGNFSRVTSVGTIFSDQAGRGMNDGSNSEPYIGQYRPTGGTLAGLLAGLSDEQIARGLRFRLVVTDVRDDLPTNPRPFPQVLDWNVKFSGRINNSGFGFDEFVASGLAGGPDNVHPNTPTTSPTVGIGPSVSVAIDPHVGSLSPYAGRQYVAYTGGGGSNSNVFVASRNPGDLSFGVPVQVNDDSLADSFTTGSRSNFMPSITVDPVTGTVVVMWYDARFDANNTRAATYVATSIDGGQTWSTQEYTTSLTYRPYLNAPKTAVDTITGREVFLEPLPTNYPGLGALGAGNSQSILAYGGRLNPFWTGNNGVSGASIYTATANIGAGPRIVASDMGTITQDGVALDNRVSVAGQTVITENGFIYNNTFVVPGDPAAGTRRLDGFVIEFDRPIHVPSLDPADFTVVYLSPTDSRDLLDNPATATFDPSPANTIAVAEIITLNPGAGPNESTRFFVRFATPQFRVGTYSYAVGPGVHDRIARPDSAPYVVADPHTFSNTTPSAFPDQGTTESTIDVPVYRTGLATEVGGGVTVQVDISNPSTDPLELVLVSARGTRVTLDSAFLGGTMTFDQTTTPDLATLIGEDPIGTFTLEITDNVAGGQAGHAQQLAADVRHELRPDERYRLRHPERPAVQLQRQHPAAEPARRGRRGRPERAR